MYLCVSKVYKRPMKQITKKYVNDLTYQIIGAAIEVHKELGPGLLESIYEKCMIRELQLRGFEVEAQKLVAVNYKGELLSTNLRLDLLVESCIVVELKAVGELLPVHKAQAMSYAKLLKVPKSILINFTCNNIFKYGQKTFVNNYFSTLPDY